MNWTKNNFSLLNFPFFNRCLKFFDPVQKSEKSTALTVAQQQHYGACQKFIVVGSGGIY
jgi:hypothetical protein